MLIIKVLSRKSFSPKKAFLKRNISITDICTNLAGGNLRKDSFVGRNAFSPSDKLGLQTACFNTSIKWGTISCTTVVTNQDLYEHIALKLAWSSEPQEHLTSLITIYIHDVLQDSWRAGQFAVLTPFWKEKGLSNALTNSVSQTEKEVVCFKIIKRNKILSTRHIFSDGALCYSAW